MLVFGGLKNLLPPPKNDGHLFFSGMASDLLGPRDLCALDVMVGLVGWHGVKGVEKNTINPHGSNHLLRMVLEAKYFGVFGGDCTPLHHPLRR